LAEPREDGSIVHTMRTGQALWTIAAYYDVDLAHLYLINSLTEDDVLHPGDEVTVRLAEGQEPPPTPTPPLHHIIREGESAWSIALQHGISTGYLYQLNNLDEYSVLHPGNELIVRLAEGQAPLPTPTPKTYHTVQSGQSLWAIAAQYNLTLEALIELNELTVQSVILQGDQLLIRPLSPTPLPEPPATPVAGSAAAPVAYPPGRGENNLAAIPSYPEPATAVGQFTTLPTTPTPLFASPADNLAEDDSSANTTLTIFIIAGLLLLAILLVIIIRQLRAQSFLP
jgi:LysM repeat protein